MQKTVLNAEREARSPLVSVIVTTKNEEKNIENCLKSVRDQTFKNVELIVVDNFSEDRTVEAAKKFTPGVYSKGPERSTQRNYGAKLANGKYLLYLDADMFLSPTVIEECVEKCETCDVGALYIPEQIVGEGFWIRVRNFERGFYNGTVVDAVRFVRKDLFDKTEGFDESLIGPEDWDLDRRIRKVGRTGIIDAAIFHNEGKFEMSRYLGKKKYYTGGIKEYAVKWGRNDREIIKQIGVWYRLVYVFVEQGKWKKLARSPLLAIAMYWLRFRTALVYLLNRN